MRKAKIGGSATILHLQSGDKLLVEPGKLAPGDGLTNDARAQVNGKTPPLTPPRQTNPDFLTPSPLDDSLQHRSCENVVDSPPLVNTPL